MNIEEIAQALAKAFITATPNNEPGQVQTVLGPYKHPYQPADAVEAMKTLARGFPYSEAGPELTLPMGSYQGAIWPFGEGWQVRVLPNYDVDNDTVAFYVTIRRA